MASRKPLGRVWIKPDGSVLPVRPGDQHFDTLPPGLQVNLDQGWLDDLARRGWIYISSDTSMIVHNGSRRSVSHLYDYLTDIGWLPHNADARIMLEIPPGRARHVTLRQAVAPITEGFSCIVESLLLEMIDLRAYGYWVDTSGDRIEVKRNHIETARQQFRSVLPKKFAELDNWIQSGGFPRAPGDERRTLKSDADLDDLIDQIYTELGRRGYLRISTGTGQVSINVVRWTNREKGWVYDICAELVSTWPGTQVYIENERGQRLYRGTVQSVARGRPPI